MASIDPLQARLLELRESFDRTFREPLPEAREEPIDLLSIRVGNEPFALRLTEIAALEADRPITRVPSQHTELLGIAGVRGALVAVFDLASLLDVPRPESVRWLVRAKGGPLAFGFSAFERQLSVPREAFALTQEGGAGFVREMVHGESNTGAPLAVVDIPGLVAALERRRRPRGHDAR